MIRGTVLAAVFALALLASHTAIPGLPIPVYAIEIVTVLAFLACYPQWRQLPAVWQRLPGMVKIALVLFVLGGIFGAVFTNDVRAALGGLKTWVLVPLLLSSFILLKPARLPWAGTAVILFALLELAAVLVGGNLFERWSGTLVSPNYFAMAMIPAALISLGRTVTQRAYWWLVVLFTVGAVMSGSLGGLLALVAASAVYGWRFLGQRGKVMTVVVILAFTVLAGVFLRERLATGARNSLTSRVEIWQVSHRLTQLYPITGVGIRGFEGEYARVAVSVLKRPPIEWVVPQPHNVVLGFWLNFGLPGLLALAFLVAWLMRVWRKQYALVLLPFTALLIHGLVDTPYFKTEIVMVFWVLFWLALTGSSKSQPDDHR